MSSQPVPWEAVAREVQKARDESIAKVQPSIPNIETDKLPLNVVPIPTRLLEAREIEITESLPEVLVEKLAKGVWSSRDVTNAFLRRAGVAQGVVSRRRGVWVCDPLDQPLRFHLRCRHLSKLIFNSCLPESLLPFDHGSHIPIHPQPSTSPPPPHHLTSRSIPGYHTPLIPTDKLPDLPPPHIRPLSRRLPRLLLCNQ